MRFKKHMALEHGLRGMDIAPLINIIFLLLFFLMFTSTFVIQSSIKVNLPKVMTSEAAKYNSIEFIVSFDNIIYMNGKVVANQELSNLIKQLAQRKQSVLIKADKRASLGRVVEIWDMCRYLGIKQINIATNQE